MSNTDKSKDRLSKITEWLDDFPGSVTCALQVWYEGLGSMGTPMPEDISQIETILAEADGWSAAGDVRYEKMGLQNSFKRAKPKDATRNGHILVQHMFGVNSLQKAPDGKVYKIVLSEVYNLRAFEVKDGNLVGSMIKIDPASDFAKSLVEI